MATRAIIGQHGTWNPDDTDWQQLLAAGQEMFAGMKQLDPTRRLLQPFRR